MGKKILAPTIRQSLASVRCRKLNQGMVKPGFSHCFDSTLHIDSVASAEQSFAKNATPVHFLFIEGLEDTRYRTDFSRKGG